MRERVWRYKGLEVHYSPGLDGDGTRQASSFVRYIRATFGAGACFRSAFEWCAGPAFIGFALLREGLCEELVVSDVNPVALESVERTVERNNLHNSVRAYQGDNLGGIPRSERFDLVVANPPNYCALNPKHHYYNWLKDDLRPNDPGWQLHKGFYGQIDAYLNPGAHLLIQEVEVFNRLVYIPVGGGIPYDIRPEPPIAAFANMIAAGGLQVVATPQYHTDLLTGLRMHLVHSVKPYEPNKLAMPLLGE